MLANDDPAGSSAQLTCFSFKNLSQSGREPNGLQVIAQKIHPVEVVAVVNENLVLRVETVNQVSTPGVGCEDRFAEAALDDRIRGLHRQVFGIEVRIHPLR